MADLPSYAVPRKVPFRHGARWIAQAFYLVRSEPLTWVLFTACYVLAQLVLGAVPVIGQLLCMVSVPLFAGGFVLAAARAVRGHSLRLADIVADGQTYWRRLLVLGGSYCALLLLVIMVMLWWVIWVLDSRMKMAEVMSHSPGLALGMVLLCGAGLFAVSLSYWFAPAEIVLAGREVWPAMRRSLAAGWANWGAMLYCGLLMGILFVLAWLPFGLGLLLWMPVMFVSVYMAWQDVLGDGLPSLR